ncbi:hypothetical protein AB6A40_009939 [Gnathostoma spinigerum]|uniref:CBS domain-containing protein n=1 Tax=Gnathostoma spinigerum TaxID=75299 RepID=A0ABD6EUN7_9BILA
MKFIFPTTFRLLDACVEFSTSRVHRIVIREPTGDILYLLSTRRILQAVHKQHRSLGVSPWLGLKIRASGIGTWGNIHSVTTKDKLKNVVRLMIDFRISSIPVVDDGNKPIDVLCKADVALALHSVKNIEEQFATMNVDEMLSLRPSCEFLSDEDTVGTVLDTLLCGVSRRCIFLRQKTTEKLVACVSLSDLVSYIMFREGSENCSKSDDY